MASAGHSIVFRVRHPDSEKCRAALAAEAALGDLDRLLILVAACVICATLQLETFAHVQEPAVPRQAGTAALSSIDAINATA